MRIVYMGRGDLTREYAKKHGKSLRWAQKQAKASTPEWRDFCGLVEVSGNESLGTGGDDLSRATMAKERAWVELERQQKMLDECKLADRMVLLSKSVRECRAAWEKACVHERKLKEAAGAMVSVSVFNELRVRGVNPLGELIKQQRDYVGSRLRAEERQSFYRVWDEWSMEWNERLSELIKEVESIIHV